MKIVIPTSWADVTVRQYIELCKVPELGFSEEDAILKELEILTGISDEVYYDMNYSDLKIAISKIAFTRQQPETKGVPLQVKLKGYKYAVNLNTKDLSQGEYIDLQNYIKEGANINLHKIIAIYLKPVSYFGLRKKCYRKNKEGQHIQTIESRRATEVLILDHLTMDKAFQLSAFFLRLYKRLTEVTQHYLEVETLKMQIAITKELQKEASLTHTHGI